MAQGRHPQSVALVQGPGGRRRGGPRRRVRRGGARLRFDRQPRRRQRRRRPQPSDCRPTSSSRPTSSPPDHHALAYGATVVPIAGTYDDVNRLCLEVADETGWGFVNINLRPYYAEGSKTLAYEIAEALGWRSPDVVVGPIASGAMFTRVARGFDELAELGLIERRPIRFVGGQAAGCAPVATAFATGADELIPVREPDTIVRSLAIGNPADGRYAVELARASNGSIEAIEDVDTARRIRDVARLEGLYPETAGGVTLGAVAAARERGVIRPGDEVVALLTGNGLKTPDARDFGRPDGDAEEPARPGQPGLAPVLRPSFSAFEAWLEGAS